MQSEVKIKTKQEIRDYIDNDSKVNDLFDRTFLPVILQRIYKNNGKVEINFIDIYLSKEPYKNFNGNKSLINYLIKEANIKIISPEIIVKEIINESFNYYLTEFKLGNFNSNVNYMLSYDIKNKTPEDIKNDNKLILKTKKELRELRVDISKSELITKEQYNILVKENVRSINKNLEKNEVTKNYKLNKYYKISPNVSNEYSKKFMEEFDSSFENLDFYVKTNEKSEIKKDLMCNVSVVVMENDKEGSCIEDLDILLKDMTLFKKQTIKKGIKSSNDLTL